MGPIPHRGRPEGCVIFGMIRPGCPLQLALYYYPDSGGHWDAHCEAHLARVGIERSPAWWNAIRHPEMHFLIIYFDDFTLSLPMEVQVCWNLTSQGLSSEKPETKVPTSNHASGARTLGVLEPYTAKVLMRLPYRARFVRLDSLRVMNNHA